VARDRPAVARERMPCPRKIRSKSVHGNWATGRNDGSRRREGAMELWPVVAGIGDPGGGATSIWLQQFSLKNPASPMLATASIIRFRPAMAIHLNLTPIPREPDFP